MGIEEKQIKLDRAAQSILSIIVRFGLESLTPSRLARSADVSRAWVYKYIGGSKDELSKFAVEHFGKLLAQIDSKPKPSTKSFFLEDEMRRLNNALDFGEKHPEIIQIYFFHKGSQSILGKAIENIESEYRTAKTFQIKSTFKVSEKDAEIYAEILSSIKMSLCHKWVLGGFEKRKILKKDFVRVVERIFKNFFEKGLA